jgi:hypothetical protein
MQPTVGTCRVFWRFSSFEFSPLRRRVSPRHPPQLMPTVRRRKMFGLLQEVRLCTFPNRGAHLAQDRCGTTSSRPSARRVLRERQVLLARPHLRRVQFRKSMKFFLLRRNCFAIQCPKESGESSNLRLTQRAPDGWESPRFLAVCWLELGSVKMALSRPAHPRVTQAVRCGSRNRFNYKRHC